MHDAIIEHFLQAPNIKPIGREGEGSSPRKDQKGSHISARNPPPPHTGRAKRIRPMLLSFMVFLSIPNNSMHDPCRRKSEDDHSCRALHPQKTTSYAPHLINPDFRRQMTTNAPVLHCVKSRCVKPPIGHGSCGSSEKIHEIEKGKRATKR